MLQTGIGRTNARWRSESRHSFRMNIAFVKFAQIKLTASKEFNLQYHTNRTQTTRKRRQHDLRKSKQNLNRANKHSDTNPHTQSAWSWRFYVDKICFFCTYWLRIILNIVCCCARCLVADIDRYWYPSVKISQTFYSNSEVIYAYTHIWIYYFLITS